MKFTTCISTLVLAAAAVAATTLDKRSHIVDEISSGVDRVAGVVSAHQLSIANITYQLVNNAQADATQLEPTIAQDLQAITGAFAVGAQAISKATQEAVGAANQTSANSGLNAPELQQLRHAIDAIISLLDGIYAAIVADVSDLAQDTQSLLLPELAGVASVIQSFITPVVAYAKVVAPLADSATAGDADSVVDGVAALECTADVLATSLGV